jgi:Zn-dependent protease with chaperone function
MAHEVAHVRRRHLIWLGVCVMATVLAALWAIAGAAGLLQELTGKEASEDLISLAAGILGLGGAGFVFGLVSRRFEWQADAFAVQHLSRVEAEAAPAGANAPRVTPAAVATMASALQAVAELNGIAANKFSWRHGSIRQRQDRLYKLVHVPLAAAPIDRQVFVIKLTAGIALALGIASMILGEIFHWISLSF